MPEPTTSQSETAARPATAECLELLKRYPADFIDEIAPEDPMYAGGPSGDLDGTYMSHARVMLDCIRMAMVSAQKETAHSILDFPSGHGRVLRLLKEEYPLARLTAGDINRQAVDFCTRTFGAIRLYGAEHPGEMQLEDRYDLIWCGSLLTHLDAPRWPGFLEFFEAALAPRGLLVVSVSGRSIAALLRDRETSIAFSPPFGAEGGDAARESMLRSYDESGFGYSEYPSGPDERAPLSEPSSYGISLVKPSWFCRLLEERSALQLVTYAESRWGRQDIVSCVRVEAVGDGPGPFRFPLGGRD